MSDHDIETLLRESLRGRSSQAPDGDPVAQRVLARVGAPPPHRRWRPWALPLAAAAVVVIAGIVIGLGQEHATTPPAVRITPPVSQTIDGSPTAPVSGTTSPPATTEVTRPAVPANLHLRDATFDSATDGHLLATVDCADGTGGCLALLGTVDGGAHWAQLNPPPARLVGDQSCASSPCVDHIRFANDRVGYAYGPDALFVTTDGGATWMRQPEVGADALQIAGDTVILVRAIDTACPDRCPLFMTAPVGSTDWRSFTVPDWPIGTVSVRLASSGQQVALLMNPVGLAKGAGRELASVLYLSADDGHHWTAKSEQCPYIGAGYTNHGFDVAMSGDGAIVLDCVALTDTEPTFVGGMTITSTDGGEHFAVPPHGGKLGAASVLAAASAAVQVVFATENGDGAPRLYRSTNGGDSWSPVMDIAGAVTSAGFSSPDTGWAVSEDGGTLWTTGDGGATWAARRPPSAGGSSSAAVASTTTPVTVPSFSAVHMVSATDGWAITDSGVLRTTDAGENWVARSPTGADITGLQSSYGPGAWSNAAFAGTDEAWLAVTSPGAVTVFHTTNAGRSWSPAVVRAQPDLGGIMAAVGISFPTPQDGWLLTNVGGTALGTEEIELYRTRDGGGSWELADAATHGQDSPTGLPEGGIKTGMGFAGDGRGWLTGYRGSEAPLWLYETADGGGTWTRATLPAPEGADIEPFPITYPPRFSGDGHGAMQVYRQVTSTSGVTVFYVTDDDGATWRPTAPITSPSGMSLWDWTDATHGVAANDTAWCTTSTAGQSWQCDPLPAALAGLADLTFTSPQLGWAVAGGRLYATGDGGHTWAPVAALLTR